MAGFYLKFVCLISFVCNNTTDISKAPFTRVYLEIGNNGKSVYWSSLGVVYLPLLPVFSKSLYGIAIS